VDVEFCQVFESLIVVSVQSLVAKHALVISLFVHFHVRFGCLLSSESIPTEFLICSAIGCSLCFSLWFVYEWLVLGIFVLLRLCDGKLVEIICLSMKGTR